jgi:hypothetical protein
MCPPLWSLRSEIYRFQSGRDERAILNTNYWTPVCWLFCLCRGHAKAKWWNGSWTRAALSLTSWLYRFSLMHSSRNPPK